jgi:hypothetical protein
LGRRAHAWSSVSVRKVHRALWQCFASVKTRPNLPSSGPTSAHRRCGPDEKHLKRSLSRGHDLRPRPRATSKLQSGFDRRVIDVPPPNRDRRRDHHTSATERGNGGKAILWSDRSLHCFRPLGEVGSNPEKFRYAHAIPQLYRDGHPPPFDPISDRGNALFRSVGRNIGAG